MTREMIKMMNWARSLNPKVPKDDDISSVTLDDGTDRAARMRQINQGIQRVGPL